LTRFLAAFHHVLFTFSQGFQVCNMNVACKKVNRFGRDIEILLYPELGYVAIFTPINFQSYILDKSKLFAPSVVVLLLI